MWFVMDIATGERFASGEQAECQRVCAGFKAAHACGWPTLHVVFTSHPDPSPKPPQSKPHIVK